MYLQANIVEKFYGNKEARVQVLKGISCGIEQGEICVLLGPSGSGKSTFLNLIGGIERIDKGELLIGGKDLAGMPDKELALYRRHTLGFVFQSYHLVSNLTVKENMESGAYLGRHPKSIEDLLERLGLTQHRNKYPNQLSGGQQQRCAIGRALAKNPELLLCDEPTGALDYHTSRDILRLLEEINRDFQTTVILVTHNAAFADMAHRVLWLKDGRITQVHCNAQRVAADALEW